MTHDSPGLISVVIPSYNCAAHLGAAVASALGAAATPQEIIIVDDGSTDATPEVAASLQGEIRYVRQGNEGPSAARNHGLRLAAGEYVRFIDADDLCAPDSTSLLVELLVRKPDVEVAMGYCQGFEEGLAPGGTIEVTGATGARLNFGVGTAVFRRAALDRVGQFRPDLRYGEDLDLLLRAREADITIEVVPDVTLYYRIHDSNSTHGKDIHELNLLNILKTSLDRRRIEARTHVE